MAAKNVYCTIVVCLYGAFGPGVDDLSTGLILSLSLSLATLLSISPP